MANQAGAGEGAAQALLRERIGALRRVYEDLQAAIDRDQPALLRRLADEVDAETDLEALRLTVVFLGDSAQDMARYWADVRVECDLLLEHLRGSLEAAPEEPPASSQPEEQG